MGDGGGDHGGHGHVMPSGGGSLGGGYYHSPSDDDWDGPHSSTDGLVMLLAGLTLLGAIGGFVLWLWLWHEVGAWTLVIFSPLIALMLFALALAP